MITIETAKRSFFDRPAVVKALDKAERRGLSKLGAFIRKRARSSLRKRKKPSAPGKPPSMHEGQIKKFLFFAYEPETKSVVVGPALLRKTSISTVPELHEHGGNTEIKEYQLSGGLWTTAKRFNFGDQERPTRTRKATYPERPYMRPAFEAELPRAPEHFKNTFIR